MKQCVSCGLCFFRKNIVPGRGILFNSDGLPRKIKRPQKATILFIGEGPGKSEDLRGESFVGKAGRTLNEGIKDAVILAKLKHAPSYYITNTVQCRPTNGVGEKNREPTGEEIARCWPNLERVYDEVKPSYIVLLGKVARVHYKRVWPDALCLHHPQYLNYRGGVESTEYRPFVRNLSELFKEIEKGGRRNA